MPSLIAHAAPALALAPIVARRDVASSDAQRRRTRRLVWLGALAAMAPDLDVLAFAFGIPYADLLGHRGLWHSLPFAAVVASALAWLALRGDEPAPAWHRAWLYLFCCIGSHGVLDAATNGGLGVALLAPFDATRFFLPFRPIEVSPLGVSAFFSARGLAVIESEVFWVWLPGLALGLLLRSPPLAHGYPGGRRDS
jgi:inner membrane protein